MIRLRAGRPAAALFAAASLLASASVARADVKSTEHNRVQFTGTLGRVVNFFGGKAAQEGLDTVIAVRGDRKMSVTGNVAQLIDLAGEKIYAINLEKKTYRVTTFDELRRQIEEDAKKAEKEQPEQPQKQDQEYETDFSVKPTGQQKTINGFDCHEVIATVTVREKGKTLEAGGGMVLTDDVWLVPTVPAMQENADFNVRYFKAIAGSYAEGVPPEQMARATSLFPGLAAAFQALNVKGASALDGTTIMSDITVESVKSPEELAQAKQDDQPSAGGGLGGLFGGLGKKLAKKAAGDKESANQARTTVMTLHHEVRSIGTSVAADEVEVPAGFRQQQ